MIRYLGLLETGGNQRFIFATNKLRENVGASELTLCAGKDWVWDAIRPDVLPERRNESDPAVNPPLGPGVSTQIVLATSGKAYFLADSEDAAKKVIRTVTTRALKDAPGIDLSGVFVKVTGTVHEAIQAAHKMLASRRGTNPGPEARFRRLPVVAECATSGLPAAKYEDSREEPGPRSAQAFGKRRASRPGINRMRLIAKKHAQRGIVYSVGDLEREAEPDLNDLDEVAKRSWLAVVHADGNGLGKVFQNFDKHLTTTSDAEYIAALQKFSRALDECTHQAFGFALKQLYPRIKQDPLPVVPIVLGGDDMTVVMDGKYAVQFTIDFLQEFEELTGKDETIKTIVGGAVTACAGVAVIKPHFPFFAAYELAEELIRSAKKFAKGIDEKKPPSAFDFHILYDASGADLDRIRESLAVDEKGVTKLVARPYLVGSDPRHPHRTTDRLEHLMGVIRAKNEDGRRAIPNSQLHDLREALFLGRDAAESRYSLIRERYDGLKTLLAHGLFWDSREKDKDGRDVTVARTHLLDALDLVEFWEDAL